jgi:hypothetical protein
MNRVLSTPVASPPGVCLCPEEEKAELQVDPSPGWSWWLSGHCVVLWDTHQEGTMLECSGSRVHPGSLKSDMAGGHGLLVSSDPRRQKAGDLARVQQVSVGVSNTPHSQLQRRHTAQRPGALLRWCWMVQESNSVTVLIFNLRNLGDIHSPHLHFLLKMD